jgi:hypothetical protein
VVSVGETGLRDQCRSLKIKKPPDSCETENEGIHVPRKTVPWAGLILLFDGEVGRK